MRHAIQRMGNLAFTLAALALAACGGGSSTGPGKLPAIRPTEPGTPTGPAVTAVIGAEGGSLATADGAITLTVPAGAVSGATTFSILPVTNNAHGGLNAAYRLEPHGIAFAQPVRIAFRYTDADLAGTTPELLRLAYQDQAGYWLMYRRPTLDEDARTVSVETTHFSDWSMVAGAQLRPAEASVRVGTTLELRVRDCYADPDAGHDDPGVPVGYDCRDGFYAITAKHWAVNGTAGGSAGVGTVTAGPEDGMATYQAPATVPAANPVAVSVAFGGAHPGDEGILVSNITVTDAAGSCAELRDVESWNGTFGLSYTFSGVNQDQDELTITHWAEVTAQLRKISEGPAGVSWQGPLTGLVSVEDRHLEHSPGGDVVTTVDGSGPPLRQGTVGDQVHAYLNVDLANCTYHLGMVPGVAAVTNRTGEPPADTEVRLGMVRSDHRPTGGSTNLTGGKDFEAHSVLWGHRNGGDAYFPDGLGQLIFLDGYATDGTAGTARVEWSFQPGE
ncbi:MAG TPA: hypothetical protein VNK43_10895 [Gemmatimonadales bacterium]|nr:hypothetical protein [Gemmatimonadales bacterium]